MNKIAPQDRRQHLMLNQSRLSTSEIADTGMQPRSFRVVTSVKLDSSLQLVTALRKVENLMECHTSLDRVALRAKDLQMKKLDSARWVILFFFFLF